MSRILILCLVLAGCGSDGPDIAGVRDNGHATVTLRLGETRPVSGTPLLLTFLRVPEDSRCPVDVYCFWEGDAAVELLVRTAVSTSDPVKLHLSLDPREVNRLGYRLTLEGLQPGRRVDQPLPPAQYRATLSVDAGR